MSSQAAWGNVVSNRPAALSNARGSEMFDTTFPHAAWEDIEIAYRMMKMGMKILYRPAAVARHYHDITFDSFRRRQEKAGEAAAIFYEKHPELGDFLGVPQALQFRETRALRGRLLSSWAALCERWDIPGGRKALDQVLRQDYLRGLNRVLGRRQSAWPAAQLSAAPR